MKSPLPVALPFSIYGLLLSGCSPNNTEVPKPKPVANASKPRQNASATATAKAWDHPITAPPVDSPTELPTPTAHAVAKRFSEDERRDIFRQIVEAEDRGSKEAEEKYPTDMNNPSLTMDQATANVEPNTDLTNKLQEKYRNEVFKEFGLTEKEQDLIGIEGSTKHWPPLYE